MSVQESAGSSALPFAAPADAVTARATAQGPRGRLFRKYVLFFVLLVGAALLVNGGFDFWFGYQENKAALIRIQQQKADAAAESIEGFIESIQRQIGWTTHAQWSAAPLDQRRFDYVRLLSQVEGYHRDAVQARHNACAGRPLRPYRADIIQR